MKCPAEVYTPLSGASPTSNTPSTTATSSSPPAAVSCIYRKKINVSTVLAGQRLGIREVDEGIRLVTFIDHDLGYIDLEQRTLQPIDNPFGPRLSPM
jgi:hypothetical protein